MRLPSAVSAFQLNFRLPLLNVRMATLTSGGITMRNGAQVFRVAVSICFLAGTIAAQEKKISRADLPAAVEKTVAQESQGATIRGFSTETENEQKLYEVELTVHGHSKDIS